MWIQSKTKSRYKQGLFFPENPDKYRGDRTNIVFRSSWELTCMKWLDKNSGVLNWGSEEIIIPYLSPLDGKQHRYFPDFKVDIKDATGKITTYILEIKPESQTNKPVKGKKRNLTFLNEMSTYAVNEAKWNSAIRYCKERNWEFKIITEKHLGIK